MTPDLHQYPIHHCTNNLGHGIRIGATGHMRKNPSSTLVSLQKQFLEIIDPFRNTMKPWL
jgi:hypothetical protein